MFFASELFPKVCKRRSKEDTTTKLGKKRKCSETVHNTETKKKSTKETRHRTIVQDRKVKKSVKFKPIKKGARVTKGKSLKSKRKLKK